jgi:predicted MFS family arabinose efflux permease
MNDPELAPSTTPIYWLALGTFAIGTEGFMIAPLLPKMATDLSVSVSAAGQLVTAFALAFAISSPILTTVTGGFNRRWILIMSMLAFAGANLFAWRSSDYGGVMVARIMLAFAAGLYVPNANALAGTFVRPERRGRALAIVNGGTTIAIVLGLPLGSMIGNHFGWRSTFLGVGALSIIAAFGLLLGLPSGAGDHMKVASMKERIAVARRPIVLCTLLITTIWATGVYTVWTYIAPYMVSAVGLDGNEISAVVFLWGMSAAIGVFAGGYFNDKIGSRAVLVPTLAALALAFVLLALVPSFLTQRQALVPVLGAVVLWGVSAWGFFPAQVARLIAIGGHHLAPIVLSLNASFMFVGFSAGAWLGAVILEHGSVSGLGWTGAAFETAALVLVLITTTSSFGYRMKVS